MKWKVTLPDGKFSFAPTYLVAAHKVEVILDTAKLPVGAKITIERVDA